jgi:DNA-binding response OmpR family regulator
MDAGATHRLSDADRRASRAPDEPAEDQEPTGQIRVFPERFEIYFGARRLKLTLVQYHILRLMARRPGWVFTPPQIVRGLEGEGLSIEAGAIKNHVYQLRRRLGPGRGVIETVRGIGYRFVDGSARHERDAFNPDNDGEP